MSFRFKAAGYHLLASVILLTVILGGLFLGWYRWPGWYLADAMTVTRMLATVDLVVGPLLTFVIAAPAKPRRVLARDLAVIAALQLSALTYGTLSLWNGRPLYYAFSEDELQVVQAYDIDPDELELARRQSLPLRPHWYSLPRWIWAPLPDDAAEQNKIVSGAIAGGTDVIGMPRYYKPWEAGLSVLRSQLRKVDDLKYFSSREKRVLKERERNAGVDADRANALALSGRGKPLLAVFDPATLKLRVILRSDP